MRALVIDDEQLVLEGLEAFLQASLPDLSLDKTAHIGTALRLAATVSYELVLLDWNLVSADRMAITGSGVVEALRSAGSSAPIVIVSGDEQYDWPRLLVDLGLSGFVPKSASGSVLLDAIHVALRGGIYLPSHTLSQRAQPAYRRKTPPAADVDPRLRFPELTERQVDVFRSMVRGRSDKQIARDLGISESTVKTHVRAILNTMGVSRRGEAVFEVTGGSHTHA